MKKLSLLFFLLLAVSGMAIHLADAQFSQYSKNPGKLVSRAEFLAMLFPTFYYEKAAGKNCFPDVKTQWFAKFVCQAKEMNIVNARADGKFQPNEPIRFIEAALQTLIEKESF